MSAWPDEPQARAWARFAASAPWDPCACSVTTPDPARARRRAERELERVLCLELARFARRAAALRARAAGAHLQDELVRTFRRRLSAALRAAAENGVDVPDELARVARDAVGTWPDPVALRARSDALERGP